MNYALPPKIVLIYIFFFSIGVDLGYGILEYYGVTAIPLSKLFRFSILGAFLICLVRQKTTEAWFVKSLLVLWLMSLSLWAVVQGTVPLGLEISTFFKVLYPICIAMLVSSALNHAWAQGQDLSDSVYNGIIYYGLIAAGAIVFSLITGIGNLTYGDYAFGIKSFFTGGNDIGLTILISLIFSWGLFWQKNSKRYVFQVLLLTFGVSLIGSRAGWGGVIVVTFVFSMLYVMFKQSVNFANRFVKVVIVVVVVSTSSAVVKLVYDNFDTLNYHADKVVALMDGISPRANLEKAGWSAIEERPVVMDVFGQGSAFHFRVYHYFYTQNAIGAAPETKQKGYRFVEQDLIDTFGVYGLVLGTLLLGYHIYYWLLAMQTFRRFPNVIYFSCFFAITFYLLHGFVAGHALSSSQVSTLIGAVYGYIQFKVKHHDEPVQT